jgi:hypothetical protein
MSSKKLDGSSAPDAPAIPPKRSALWALAVQVRRTVPRDLTNAQADALMAEFARLPRLSPITTTIPSERHRKTRGNRRPVAA